MKRKVTITCANCGGTGYVEGYSNREQYVKIDENGNKKYLIMCQDHTPTRSYYIEEE